MAAVSANCREALAAGQHLVALAVQPLTPERMERVEALLEQREAAIQASLQALGGQPVPGDASEILQALIHQQQTLETEFATVLQDLRQRAEQRSATRGSLASFQRLIRPSARPQHLNQKR